MKYLLLAVFILCISLPAFSSENLIENGDFEKKTRKWDGKIDDALLGENWVGIVELHRSRDQVFSQKFRLEKDTYELGIKFKYKVRTDYKGRGFRVMMKRPNGSYIYWDKKPRQNHLDWQDVSLEFSKFNGARDLTFQVEVRPGEGSIYFDDVIIVSQ